MIKNFFLSILLCLIVTVSADAAKSAGTVRMVMQPDGTMLSIQLLGDEHFSWYQTADGVLLVQQDKTFYVGAVTGTGTLESSGIIAHNSGERSAEEQAAAANQDKTKFFAKAEEEVSKSKMAMSGSVTTIPDYPNPAYCPHTGTVKVPVILMNYTDTVFRIGKTDEEVRAAFNTYFNGTQKTPYSKSSIYTGYSSVSQYFKDASSDALQFEFEVYGPYTTDYNHNHYGDIGNYDLDLLTEAVKKADPDINFSDYVQSGHGYVNLVCVMYAGAGANLSGDRNDFWPACYQGMSISTSEGKWINMICGFPELAVYPYQFDGDTVRAGIGVTCHEISHGMGLPDLYNTTVGSNYGAKYNNAGPEEWDIMDGGENTFNGMWPCQYAAWEREIMGWLDVEELSEGSDVTIYPLNKEGGKAYRVTNPANSNEYYIIENYQYDEWNWFQNYYSGAGLMISHINTFPNGSSTAISSAPNNTIGKPNISVLPADNLILSSYNIGHTIDYRGKSTSITSSVYFKEQRGDPYPGTGNVTSLAAYKNYTGNEMVTNYPITDIRKNADGSVTFKFMGGTPGDANGDYSVDVTDITVIISYLNGETPDNFHEMAADVNRDGIIDLKDVKDLENKLLEVSE